MTISEPRDVPPGVPANLITPTGNVPRIGVPNTQDYPRLVFTSPYFETVAIAEIIQPSVTEAVENVLPSLIPPYVDAAVLAGVQQYSVLLTGSTMSGPLFLNPLMPTQPSQAATMAYVDAMLATAGIPEVPPVPTGQVWARETGQWVPISQTEGTFLPLTGGTMQGIINMSGNTITNMAAVPAMPNGAAPAQWVLNQIASVSLYQGTWDADTNAPDLTQLSVRVNGYTWIALTSSPSGVVIGPAIPGLQGMTIFNGDTIIYSTVAGQFQAIHAGGLTLPEADARYVQLAGSQMSGALLLNANASQPLQAVTYQQLEAAVANTVTPDAPADGQGYLRVGVGTNRWVPGLPLAGGILTGALTLAGPGASGNNAVTVSQLNSAITASTAGLLPIAGGTMTGPIVLAGNATVNLNPVPLQQLNSMLGSYLPLGGGTLTGGLTINNGAANTSIQAQGSINGGQGTIGGVTLNAGTVSANAVTTATNFYGPSGGYSLLAAGGSTAAQINFESTASTFTGSLTVQNALSVSGNINTNGGLVAGFMVCGGNYYGPDAYSLYVGSSPGTPIFTLTSAGMVPTSNGNLNNGAPGNAWFQVASYNFPNESDPRLKSGMAPAPDGAEAIVNAIPVHTFSYTTDPTHATHTGFDATEVQAHHPNAIMTGEDEAKTLAVNLPDMIAMLWKAVQELSAEVAALRTAPA